MCTAALFCSRATQFHSGGIGHCCCVGAASGAGGELTFGLCPCNLRATAFEAGGELCTHSTRTLLWLRMVRSGTQLPAAHAAKAQPRVGAESSCPEPTYDGRKLPELFAVLPCLCVVQVMAARKGHGGPAAGGAAS